jgi:hypothetical protein
MKVLPFNIITPKKKKKAFNIEHINTEEKFNIICKIIVNVQESTGTWKQDQLNTKSANLLL